MIRFKVRMVQNDTAPPTEFDIVNDDAVYNDAGELTQEPTPYDLTGCIVKFIIKSPNGVVTNAAHQACGIADALLGNAIYNYSAGDLPNAGTYKCDLEVTDASSRKQTAFDIVEIIARAQNN